MESISILSIVKEGLIGKELKYVIRCNSVMQAYSIFKKKSHSVTDEQFNGPNPKFKQIVHRSKMIGRNIIFATNTIVDISINEAHYGDEIDTFVFHFDDGTTREFSVIAIFDKIGPNQYMAK